MRDIGRILIVTGVVLALAGVILTLAGRTGIGRLPGDFVYKRGAFTFYFPLMTSVLLSMLLTFLMWLFRR